jgi:Spy/CpxP family protein refolding chaperone
MTLSKPNRRLITVAAVAASLVAIVGATFAYAHSGGGQHGHMAHRGSGHHLEHVQAMLTKIGATDVQKAQIEGLIAPALDDMKAAHQAHSAAFEKFHEAITATSIDRARLESLRAEQVKSLDETSRRLVTAIGDAAEVLSPEQRAKLAEQIRKHHGG